MYSHVTNKKLKRVPCIRIFGHVQETGESVCLYVHDFFPSLLVRKPRHVSTDLVVDALDAEALFEVTMHKKLDIYGYCPEPIDMIKVKTVSPVDVARLATIVQEKFPNLRVYNVHIPYLLQFLIDHNLQGLSVIRLDTAHVRTLNRANTTFCKVEIHANVAAIKNSAHLVSQPKNYPVPKPLVRNSQATPISGVPLDDLICGSALDPVWEEEAQRCMRLNQVFPYEPEGIGSGAGRPGVEELDFVQERVAEVKRLSESANFANTQDLLAQLEQVDHPRSQFAENSDDDRDHDQDQQLVGNHVDAGVELDQSDHDLISPTIMLSTQRPGTERSLPTTLPPLSQRLPASLNRFSQDDVQNEPRSNVTVNELDDKSTSVAFLESRTSQVLVFPRPPSFKESRCMTAQSKRWSLTGSLGNTPRIKEFVGPAMGKDQAADVTYNTLLAIELIVARGEGAVNLNEEEDALLGFVVLFRDQRTEDKLMLCLRRCGAESLRACSSFEEVVEVEDERNALIELNKIFREFDPCVVLAWDCGKMNKYLYKRAQLTGMNLEEDFNLSRLVGFDPTSPVALLGGGGGLPGRVSLDLWRLLRSHESGLNLGTTSFEGCVQAVLGLTFPCIPMSTIAAWLSDEVESGNQLRGATTMAKRTRLLLEMLDASMLLDRAVEMARIYGCDVSSVLSRGSQFRVECMLARASRRSGFVLVSSSKQQVKNQMAPEGIPLVLEPKSGFYSDPVCVLDFQSLYPSIMIAYNICYSTCLGKISDRKVVPFGTQGQFERDLRTVLDEPGGVVATPGDVMFVGRETRVGILPRMLHEVIQTRFMVKRAMKKASLQDKTLARKLDARQLTLKLLANVTYGYTGASFSGRMPCGEVADAIVLTGRRTLERAMATAEAMGGEVIYGDTDSLFVRFKDASLEEAFERGYALAEAVTKANPWPMKLQMEKVYWPCCMITKKRYVGRAFDAPSGTPRFDAKGIETVRRDNCPLTAKTLAKVLEALFENPRVSHPEMTLHAVVKKEIGRIYRDDGIRNIRDFIFQNQVRTDYKDPDHLPPAARVAANQELHISSGQRVAYVVSRRGPDALLSDQVVTPSEVISGRAMIDIDYYINRQIVPALQRTLGLQLSVSLSRWIAELPKRKVAQTTSSNSLVLRRCRCLLCAGKASKPVSAPVFCDSCLSKDVAACIAAAVGNLNRAEARLNAFRNICLSCAGDAQKAVACSDAYHCSVYFDREREARVCSEAKEDFIHATKVAEDFILDW